MAFSRRTFLQASTMVGLAGPALAACAPSTGSSPAPFRYGVASGDPDSQSVVLWTRHDPGIAFVTTSRAAPAPARKSKARSKSRAKNSTNVTRSLATVAVPVRWEISQDESFSNLVGSGEVQALPERDWTVKVIPTGLAAGTTYYYRFISAQGTSVVGRTKTAPTGPTSALKLGFVACSNFGWGAFHAYRHLANRTDLDAVVHLGDYIYEHASAGFGDTYGTHRALDPLGEILSLGDYRRRYALYRTDPDLSELHRLHPMICIWDDHEFANDPKAGGAQNHTPATEGDWFQRVGFATQAHAEWMPTRVEGDVAYRSLQFGSLATLVLVDRQRRYLFPQPDDGDLYLGRAQAEWLDATLSAAESTWVILGSPSNFGPNVAGQTGGGWGLRDRTRAINAFRASRSGNLVVAVGDIHKFRAMDIPFVPGQYDPATGAGSAGVEFAVGSVTSPGATDPNPGTQVKYSNGSSRGYTLMTFTGGSVDTEFFGFDDALKTSSQLPAESRLAGFRVAAGTPHLVPMRNPT